MQNSTQNINKMASYDLHCHSTASDGLLTPTQLVERANQQGVEYLALTDHDTVAGIAEAQLAAQGCDLHLIPGIELSASWENKCFHVIGLGIDPLHPLLLEGLRIQENIREERAKKIADKLAKKRIHGAYEAVKTAARDSMITRSHFAQFIVEQNRARDLQDAFDKFLAQGKPAYVPTAWAELADVVAWISGSGGVAVLAHPLRYNLSATWMRRALTEFKQLGGQGIEVVTGRSNADEIHRTHQFAKQFELFASTGSDFHSPDQWVELGRLSPLPPDSRPVWELLH